MLLPSGRLLATRVCMAQPQGAKVAQCQWTPIVHVRQGTYVAVQGLFCAVFQGEFGKCGPSIKRQGEAWSQWAFDGHQITSKTGQTVAPYPLHSDKEHNKNHHSTLSIAPIFGSILHLAFSSLTRRLWRHST